MGNIPCEQLIPKNSNLCRTERSKLNRIVQWMKSLMELNESKNHRVSKEEACEME